MTRIQSSVGLVTGIPIQEMVNQLMSVAGRPKELIVGRSRLLESEKLAITQLSSLLLAFQFETKGLGSASLFTSKQVSSSKPAALSVALATGGSPAVGSYQFTPVQTASAQQFLSQSFPPDAAIGAGSFTIGKGGFVDKGISLDELNAGAGVQRGKIRITDRNGDSAIIDLSIARTVDDVLRAINENTAINVTAAAVGDGFKLLDTSGGSGNLKVQEVTGGTAAAGLGLAGIDLAANEALGSDVFTLHTQTKLSLLNDGTGVQIRSGGADLSIALADESTVEVDLAGSLTLGDVLEKLNAADPAKLSAEIAPDGNRLVLTDLTVGSGTLAVSNVGSGTAADDLGLTTIAVGATVTGRRLVSGLRDTLVSSLRGGQGLGELGLIDITNRNNVASSVDLSGAETLGQIIAAINDQATGVTASVNAARNGVVLTDTTGASASNLIVADGDATSSATALGIVANVAATSVDSGTLGRRTVSAATLLSSLNGGVGIQVGDFKITDSAGNLGAVDLNPSGNVATTIGDVIDRVNALSNVGVVARINDNGDGIVLIDTAGGAGTLKVTEVGNGTTAKDLRILGSAVTVDIQGTPTQVVDGSATVTVTIGAEETLAELVTKINGLGLGVVASVLNDGVGGRLSITASKSGEAGELLIDTSGSPLTLQEVERARDALLLYGASGSAGGALIASSSNTFNNVVSGINLTVNSVSAEAVTVSVKTSGTALAGAVQEFVDAYNSIRNLLDQTTDFNEEELSTGILFGTREALRVETDLAHVLTSRFFGVGAFQSLEAVGIGFDDKGRMQLDQAKLTAAYESNPEALKTFFTHESLGVAAKLEARIEQLAGANHSLLSARSQTLTRILDDNKQRVERWDARLDRQRERLLMEFFRIEETVAKMQQSLSALSSMQVLPSLVSQRA